jgi:hypothetical protein
MKNFWMAVLVAFTAIFFNTGCAQKSIFRDSPLLVKGFIGLGFMTNNEGGEYYRVLINRSEGDPYIGDIGPYESKIFDAGWGWNYTPSGKGYRGRSHSENYSDGKRTEYQGLLIVMGPEIFRPSTSTPSSSGSTQKRPEWTSALSL